MKVLNLYAGIGGNRALWGNEHQITAVEIDPYIADLYRQMYPADTVIVGDAHQYLLEHYMDYDFIWSSPPCPTHSKLNRTFAARGILQYPDMTLYQEILLLRHFCYKPWVIENVMSYYDPLVKPSAELARHYFWSNYNISKTYIPRKVRMAFAGIRDLSAAYGIDMPRGTVGARKLLRNAVIPELGLHIFECRDYLTQERML